MTRKTFLTLTVIASAIIGTVALFFPSFLICEVKHAAPSPAANAMARTVGALILSVGALNFLVRSHPQSPTLRAILTANIIVHLGLLPLDPIAYATGTFHTLGSFLPNSLLHVVFAAAFAHYRSQPAETHRG